jgi:hypothetical protein
MAADESLLHIEDRASRADLDRDGAMLSKLPDRRTNAGDARPPD